LVNAGRCLLLDWWWSRGLDRKVVSDEVGVLWMECLRGPFIMLMIGIHQALFRHFMVVLKSSPSLSHSRIVGSIGVKCRAWNIMCRLIVECTCKASNTLKLCDY
jgi:hypothetical protein